MVVMKYEAVVFDLDGTLTDTLSDLKNSVNYALSEFGFPERSLDEVRRFVGNGVRRLMYLSVPDGTPQTTAEDCLAVFKKHYKENSLVETKPYDGIMPMLNELKRRGVKTAVVTNNMQEAAADIVRFFFDGLIDETIGQTDGAAQKPQPDGVFLALKKLGVSTGKSVYVGDSDVDCVTARNAGLPCIGAAWGFRGREVLAENGADFIIDRPSEILDLI